VRRQEYIESPRSKVYIQLVLVTRRILEARFTVNGDGAEDVLLVVVVDDGVGGKGTKGRISHHPLVKHF
jgi:hypothetical protein